MDAKPFQNSKLDKVVKRIQKAIYYYMRDDLSRSEDQAKRALKALQRHRMRPSYLSLEIGKILNNIGVKRLQRGHFKEATSLLQKALILKREVIGRQHESSIGTLKMLIESSIYSCEFDLTKECINEVLALSREIADESLKKYGEAQREILDNVVNNKPIVLIGGVSFSGNRYTVPLLDSVYSPKLFDRIQAIVENINVDLMGYETLRCSVSFRVSPKDPKDLIVIGDPFFQEQWKVEAPLPLKSRIANSTDNFVVFVDDNMSLRKDQLNLVDEKGREIQFELRGGLWDVFTPSSYPRFGHAHQPSGQIPLCKQFTFFRGKGFVFRWKLDLGVTYELQFTVDTTYIRDETGMSVSGLGFLFPFKFVSVQRMIASHPSKELIIQSIRAKPIVYHKTRQGAGIIPVQIDPSEISLRKVGVGMHYDLSKESLEDVFRLDQTLDLEDYRMLGMQISYFLPENLTVWVKTWDQPIPTGIYHTFVSSKKYQVPLVNYRVVNNTDEEKKVFLCTRIEGFTEEQKTTVTIPPKTARNVTHLPPILEGALDKLTETRVTNICTKAVQLDGSERLILDDTYPVRLLTYDTMIWQVTDPSTGITEDLSRHIAAWVTPHALGRVIENLIRKAVEFHPQKVLAGYHGAETPEEQADIVRRQVKAIYDALKNEYKISYVSSPICFGTDMPDATQRVRLPRDSIESRSANCIDCSVLFASALEHIGINPVIVLIPGHAFIGWETWQNSGEYQFLETTIIHTSTFEEALRKGSEEWQNLFLRLSHSKKKFLPIALLRKDGVLPMSY